MQTSRLRGPLLRRAAVAALGSFALALVIGVPYSPCAAQQAADPFNFDAYAGEWSGELTGHGAPKKVRMTVRPDGSVRAVLEGGPDAVYTGTLIRNFVGGMDLALFPRDPNVTHSYNLRVRLDGGRFAASGYLENNVAGPRLEVRFSGALPKPPPASGRPAPPVGGPGSEYRTAPRPNASRTGTPAEERARRLLEPRGRSIRDDVGRLKRALEALKKPGGADDLKNYLQGLTPEERKGLLEELERLKGEDPGLKYYIPPVLDFNEREDVPTDPGEYRFVDTPYGPIPTLLILGKPKPSPGPSSGPSAPPEPPDASTPAGVVTPSPAPAPSPSAAALQSIIDAAVEPDDAEDEKEFPSFNPIEHLKRFARDQWEKVGRWFDETFFGWRLDPEKLHE